MNTDYPQLFARIGAFCPGCAQERADKLVSDDEIVQRAREEARIIRNEAKMDADEMKLKVTHEALQMLAGVEDELAEALNAVRRNRKQLDDDAQ